MQFVTSVKTNQVDSFFTKFEEARATMKEADIMLNALLKANENAKQLTDLWKQAGVELIMEKESLINKIEQLKELTRLKDAENEMLQDPGFSANSLASLQILASMEVESENPVYCLVMNNTGIENYYDVKLLMEEERNEITVQFSKNCHLKLPSAHTNSTQIPICLKKTHPLCKTKGPKQYTNIKK
ncbi:hypothetical protein U1Q18_020737 [Sarracenia purpurea var. burkii]